MRQSVLSRLTRRAGGGRPSLRGRRVGVYSGPRVRVRVGLHCARRRPASSANRPLEEGDATPGRAASRRVVAPGTWRTSSTTRVVWGVSKCACGRAQRGGGVYLVSRGPYKRVGGWLSAMRLGRSLSLTLSSAVGGCGSLFAGPEVWTVVRQSARFSVALFRSVHRVVDCACDCVRGARAVSHTWPGLVR